MKNKEYKNVDSEILNSIVNELSLLNRNFSKAGYSPLYPGFAGRYITSGRNGLLWKGDERKVNSAYMKIVTDCLRDFGIHMNNIGFTYIIEAVRIVLDIGSFDIRLVNDVYPFIARKYNITNQESVEHSIRNAITTAYRDYTRDPNSNRMGLFRKKPTNKEFVFYVSQYVSRSLDDVIYPVLN